MYRIPTTRRAFTLIELMIVISLMTLVLSAVAVLFKAVWQANRAAKDYQMQTRSIQRLAIEFRDDVHAASSIKSEGNKFTIDQPQNQRTVVYEAAGADAANGIARGGGIQRSVSSKGQVSQRDDFALPVGAAVAFDDDAADERGVASLIVSYPLSSIQPQVSDRRTLRIEAAVPRRAAPQTEE